MFLRKTEHLRTFDEKETARSEEGGAASRDAISALIRVRKDPTAIVPVDKHDDKKERDKEAQSASRPSRLGKQKPLVKSQGGRERDDEANTRHHDN